MNYQMTVAQASEAIKDKLRYRFGVSEKTASNEEFYKSVALTLRDLMTAGRTEFMDKATKAGTKQVYYLSLEFLLGRSLKNNLFNLGLEETFRKALKEMGVSLDSLYEQEPDAGLGNGGLGRLAACFMDGFASQGYPAMGYSLRYEYGIFKQKLVEGWQTELPDFWLPGGKIWLQKVEEAAQEVHFGGRIEEIWKDGYHSIEHKDYQSVTAIPYDMYIAGIDGKGISLLRIWKAVANGFDMSKFNSGDYMKAMEQNAMAEAITKVLYPEDNHIEGKTLRLDQQYFLVSASVQDIIKRHLYEHGTLDNLPELAAVHLNDTHPILAIPEMMRIMLDECGYTWDAAWDIVQRTIAYTNHTVMPEALETWNADLFKMRMPRIYQIVEEINRRFWTDMRNKGVDEGKIWRMAPICNGYVKMANLACIACHSVNGVAALHSEIIKDVTFNDFYTETPWKFKNVTNGIAHRRWLNQSNPELANLITDLIGKDYIYDSFALENLMKYKDDKAVLEKLGKIKHNNKVRLAAHLKKTQNQIVDPDTLFDVQVKRLHEYKRQHMNALHILSLYQWLRDNPNVDVQPQTFFFGAKAAPGYYFAKQIIQFISKLANQINNDPVVNKKLKVVFVENYCVSEAEALIPAAEISEQISLAGTEASGTSNMKFMINGAITMGTLDGANVEIRDAVGDENIFLFGMTTPQVNNLKANGYRPRYHYDNNPVIRRALDELNRGYNGKNFADLYNALINVDQYMALADFDSYAQAHRYSLEVYKDQNKWNQMSLVNIAKSGIFAADRSIRDYENTIWLGKPVPETK
ncbi:MAG: glycogen/starch/alpha-glucan phosphorylase [Clostridia bacterium]|nr:glycogen/starch/alpha-glucan phosphorylase [Clostridia bacterium]